MAPLPHRLRRPGGVFSLPKVGDRCEPRALPERSPVLAAPGPVRPAPARSGLIPLERRGCPLPLPVAPAPVAVLPGRRGRAAALAAGWPVGRAVAAPAAWHTKCRARVADTPDDRSPARGLTPCQDWCRGLSAILPKSHHSSADPRSLE